MFFSLLFFFVSSVCSYWCAASPLSHTCCLLLPVCGRRATVLLSQAVAPPRPSRFLLLLSCVFSIALHACACGCAPSQFVRSAPLLDTRSGKGDSLRAGGGVSLVAHFCGGPPPFFFCVCSGRCPSFLPSPHHFSFIDSLALFFRVSSLSSASPLPLYLRGFQSYIASSKPKDALIDRLWVQHSEQK